MAKKDVKFTDDQQKTLDNAIAYRAKQVENFGENSPQVNDADKYISDLKKVFSGDQI